MQVRAWSKSPDEPKCVDCGAHATHLLTYVIYQIGDVVCNLHRVSRSIALGRRIKQIEPLAYSNVKLVT